MAESTLSLDFSELRSEIAYALGYRRSFRRHGQIDKSGNHVTLDSSTTSRSWPEWATAGRLHWYTSSTETWTTTNVTSRTSDTVLLVSDTSTTLTDATEWLLTPWSQEEEDDIGACIDSGLRQFYYPPPLQGEGNVSHNWSFLEPEFTFTIFADYSETTGETVAYGTYDSTLDYTPVSIDAGSQVFRPEMVGQTFVANDESEYEIVGYVSSTQIIVSGDASGETDTEVYSITTDAIFRLPDEHAGFTSDISFSESDNSYYSIERTSANRILSLRQQNLGQISPSARPLYAAEVPIRASDTRAFRTSGNAVRGLRYELHVWPGPNGTFTMHATHNELQDTTSMNDFPMGGMAHGETILASCLAAAELKVEDKKGIHWQTYMERLRASVHRDRVQFTPSKFGYNGDKSDSRGQANRYYKPATYNSVEYFGD